MKEKIKKILIPWRENLDKKWWHRLALVFIYGSTIFMAIFLAILLVSEGNHWVSESYTAYSFEKGYLMAKGKEIDCKFSATGLSDLPVVSIFRCGDLSSNSEFLDKYSRARGTYEKLEEVRKQTDDTFVGNRILERVGRIQRANATDNEILVQLIQGGELDNIKVKRVYSVDYASLLGNWGIYVLLVLGWFIFWESIIYRVILYIIYGKSKTI